MISCVKCKTSLPDEANFCSHCGFPVGSLKICRSCTECGANLSAIDRFCSQCGKPVRVVKSTDVNPFVNSKSNAANNDVPKMIAIEGGEFLMGGAASNCVVNLTSFFLSETPVTQRQYFHITGQNPSKLQGEDKPVEMVNWCEAVIFCNILSARKNLTPCYSIGTITDLRAFDSTSPVWKRISCNFLANGFRLPTEAEWEFAARGGKNCDPFSFAGNSDIDKVAWYGENSNINSHTVGTKAPNSLGLFDMCGNVTEWCWDYFENDFPTKSQLNPHGPQIGNMHVKRGGSWLDDAPQCTVFYRSASAPAGKSSSLGFRICQTNLNDPNLKR
ncbi:SUMF1/EgtB/PvdO family nonheme iron enzyme [uncultured Treponema sp.]|uniref:SUMF1/EgtB/PvdO family nonheme iron enzyme n=1 Tax=uncultured Treponema sp. TaxID=162155 RepID=UPI0025E7284D|nr:SUMF1/EgtB/PvdO family nonheme iron enzyme [uncultured Treponema sp.]